jgi:3-methyladenine DNA glycosylase/8-oxoguanine DNA glycosylase
VTNRLKDLMTEAADDRPSYVPDVEALIRAGRRQLRQCRLMKAAAAVVLIAIARRTAATR